MKKENEIGLAAPLPHSKKKKEAKRTIQLNRNATNTVKTAYQTPMPVPTGKLSVRVLIYDGKTDPFAVAVC